MSNKNTVGRAIADAAKQAAANEDRRAIAIVNLCEEHGQPLQQATQLILSGKSIEQCAAELKKNAVTAGWNRATGNGEQAPAGEAGWDAALARVNGQ